MKLALLLLIISPLLFACNKDASEKGLLWQCDTNQTIDSTATTMRLAGTWRLVQQRLSPAAEVVMADKNVIVTFNSDATFTVLENASVTAQGSWSLYRFSNSIWALNLTAPSPYLRGYISFCNNKVLFTDSVVDGSDNLFEKAD